MTPPCNHAFSKPKLIPVQVPWQIDLSTPYLTLITSESSWDQPTEVTFIAHSILEDEIIPLFYKTRRSDSGVIDENRYVKVTVNNSSEVDFCGKYSDLCVINYDNFDCSALERFSSSTAESNRDNWEKAKSDEYLDGEECERNQKMMPEYLKHEREQWLQTGICPDPYLYVVENSNWLKRDSTGSYLYPEYKHFIFVGHNAYVEVTGTGLEWEYINFPYDIFNK